MGNKKLWLAGLAVLFMGFWQAASAQVQVGVSAGSGDLGKHGGAASAGHRFRNKGAERPVRLSPGLTSLNPTRKVRGFSRQGAIFRCTCLQEDRNANDQPTRRRGP